MKYPFMLVLFLAYLYPQCDTEGRPFLTNGKKNENRMTIAGVVVEEGSKLPVNTSLTIKVEGFNPIKTTTNTNGQFSANIPMSEEFKIVVHAPGFETQENIIHYPVFEEGAPEPIEIELIPFVKLTLNGLVLSESDKTPLTVEFNVYRFSDFIKVDSKTVNDGKYSQSLTDFGWYMIDFSAPGYLDVTDTVWVLNCKRKTIRKNYYLTPIEKGLTMQLNEIHFNFGKTTLSPDSYSALDKMATFLSKNPSLQVEVAGHTDSEGPDDYNLFLSQARAEAVLKYIVDKGISKDQLIAKGYGETKPVDTNETYAGMAKNRRVELVVLKR
jgi:outer membrane protein OmpA-like peptidoglycan-associated protein